MGADAGKIGLLDKSMHGTRDAACKWGARLATVCQKLEFSAWAQLEEFVSSGMAPSFRNDTRRRLRAHGTDRTTDRI